MTVARTYAAAEAESWTSSSRYRHGLWLLTKRDLRVRYSTSALGYLWSVLDPLVMAAIYYFVFTVVFHRRVGADPYIVYLLAGLLPWMWFNGAVTDCTRAFLREAKLIRSTKIPRTIWVARLVLSKGIEFVASIPVLALFVIFAGATLHVEVLWWLLAIVLQAALTFGIGLLVAPLVVFFRDLERAALRLPRVATAGGQRDHQRAQRQQPDQDPPRGGHAMLAMVSTATASWNAAAA